MTKIWTNISNLATLSSAYNKNGRYIKPEDLSIIQDGAVAFDENRIFWVGKTKDIPEQFERYEQINLSGKTVTPALVDSHTHLIFGGDRSFEYSMRLNGNTYEEIANAGGGILETSNGTKSLSIEALIKESRSKINRIKSYGVKTIEVKSGYGLDYKTERMLTLAIDQLKKEYYGDVEIFNTYMAAHAIPKEFSSSTEYLNNIVKPLLKELAPLNIIDAVDIFHEKNYFTKEDVTELFKVAKSLNIPTKIHADEFFDNSGLKLAIEHQSLSADHLLKSNPETIKKLNESKTVATLLPGTSFFLGKDLADARLFLDSGAKVAIASDYNPGSCHCDNLLMLASLAAPSYKMNIAELWTSITLNAAHALNMPDRGAIVSGLKPIMSIWDEDSINKITYNWGRNKNLQF